MNKKDPETQVSRFSKAVSDATFELLKTNQFKDGQSALAIRKLAVKVIGQFIEELTLRTLNAKLGNKASEKEEYNFVQANYMDFKKDLKEEIAFGLSRGISKFSGQEVDYYCDIKLFPPAVNKYDC